MNTLLLLAALLAPNAQADQCPGFQSPEEEKQLLDEGAEASYDFLLAKYKAAGVKVRNLMFKDEAAWMGALGDCGAKNYSNTFEVIYQTEKEACIVRGQALYFGRFNEKPTVSVVEGSETKPDCIEGSKLR